MKLNFKKNKNIIKEKDEEIYILMQRKRKTWKKIKKFSLLFLLFLLVLTSRSLFPDFIPNFFILDNIIDGLLSFELVNINLFFIGLFGYISLSILVRPRYFIIDKKKGILYYSLPIIGQKKYYFIEIERVHLEIDMSESFKRLEGEKIYSIYIKLYNGKELLICELEKEEKAKNICETLKAILNVQHEEFHKIGNKRETKIELGNYIIEKELTHGGMGKIFLAIDKRNKQKVAIKILPALLAKEEERVESFKREVKILQKINHKNIVRIYEFGKEKTKEGTLYFYAMEYIEGETLSKILKSKNSLTLRDKVEITLQIANALDYIHKNKIVHRDIKPSNIMLKKDKTAVLIDFGLARIYKFKYRNKRGRYCSSYIELSHYVGTIPYMSPEQICSEYTIDHRTDIYSLGITLYQMLTGKLPFYKLNERAMFRAILYKFPVEPSKINPEIPKELDIITLKAIEKKKEKRYQTAKEFAEDLKRWLNGEPILSKPISIITKILRKINNFIRFV